MPQHISQGGSSPSVIAGISATYISMHGGTGILRLNCNGIQSLSNGAPQNADEISLLGALRANNGILEVDTTKLGKAMFQFLGLTRGEQLEITDAVIQDPVQRIVSADPQDFHFPNDPAIEKRAHVYLAQHASSNTTPSHAASQAPSAAQSNTPPVSSPVSTMQSAIYGLSAQPDPNQRKKAVTEILKEVQKTPAQQKSVDYSTTLNALASPDIESDPCVRKDAMAAIGMIISYDYGHNLDMRSYSAYAKTINTSLFKETDPSCFEETLTTLQKALQIAPEEDRSLFDPGLNAAVGRGDLQSTHKTKVESLIKTYGDMSASSRSVHVEFRSAAEKLDPNDYAYVQNRLLCQAHEQATPDDKNKITVTANDEDGTEITLTVPKNQSTLQAIADSLVANDPFMTFSVVDIMVVDGGTDTEHQVYDVELPEHNL